MPYSATPFALPSSEGLETKKLAQIFNHVTLSYKFLWFTGILEKMVKKDETTIPIDKLAIAMVSYAWYPIARCKLSFGKIDSLKNIVGSPYLSNQKFHDEEEIQTFLESELTSRPDLQRAIDDLLNNVPHRLVAPWIGTGIPDKESWKRLEDYSNGSLYRIRKIDNKRILELNPSWLPYLKENYQILSDFVHWNLVKYVQARNPNVPNVVNKLDKPMHRPSMKSQKDFWRELFNSGFKADCIYTGIPLVNGNYDLDHFLPWNFVFHNQLWNLIPANPNVNSSKSDKIPGDEDLKNFSKFQKNALTYYRKTNLRYDLLEDDYEAIEVNINEIVNGSEDQAGQIYSKVISPLAQQAVNLGFEVWRRN